MVVPVSFSAWELCALRDNILEKSWVNFVPKVQAWIIFFLWRVDNNLKVINSNGTELLEVLRISVSLEQKEKLSHHCIQSPHFVDIYMEKADWYGLKSKVPVTGGNKRETYHPHPVLLPSCFPSYRCFVISLYNSLWHKTFREPPSKRLNLHFSLSFSFCAFNAYFTCENSE